MTRTRPLRLSAFLIFLLANAVGDANALDYPKQIIKVVVPFAAAGVTDIVAVARGAGIANSAWVRDAAHFDTLIDRRFDEGGPVLIAAKIDDQPAAGPAVRDPALIRNRFMKGLGTSRGGVLDA